jgi:predicted HicB family RNase H-like nuclease
MEETKKSSYNGYTNARKEANKRYMENFVEIKVRTTPQHRETIKAHAEAHGESVNGFIGRAINETMERDNGQQAPTSEPDKE